MQPNRLSSEIEAQGTGANADILTTAIAVAIKSLSLTHVAPVFT